MPHYKAEKVGEQDKSKWCGNTLWCLPRSPIATIQEFEEFLVRNDTIKLLKENLGKSFSDMNCNNISQSKRNKSKNKWDLIKLKLFHSKENHWENKKTTYGMERNTCKWCNWWGVIAKIYKQLIKLNTKKLPNQKVSRRPKQTFFQTRHTLSQQAHEKMLNTLIIRQIQIKTTMRFHLNSNQNDHHQKV